MRKRLPHPDLFPDYVYLRRIDSVRNMSRFYVLRALPDLWGNWELVREWGRIGSAGRMLREPQAGSGAALDALARAAEVRRRRGYVEV